MTSPRTVSPIELIVLQGTPFCNLDCKYCYLSKQSRQDKASMTLETIERVFKMVFSSGFASPSLRVVWHCGEPLVLGTSYYGESMAAILRARDQHAPHVDVKFDVQTNATLITPAWCDFFKAHADKLSIGVSCDGPAFLHDQYRVGWTGLPSSAKTVRGMVLLRSNCIRFSAIAVLNRESLAAPEAFHEFFSSWRDSIDELQFNLVDEFAFPSDDRAARDELANAYADFLSVIVALEGRADPMRQSGWIRNFRQFYQRVAAHTDGSADAESGHASRPLTVLNVDVRGNVSSFYAGLTEEESRDLYGDGKGLLLGNVLTSDVGMLASSPKAQRIAENFDASAEACRRECDHHGLCSGGYALVKHKRFGRFDVAETPECFVQVKVFARVMLDQIISPAEALSSP